VSQTRRSFVASIRPRPLQAPCGVAALFVSRASAAIAQAAMLVLILFGWLGLPLVAGAQSVLGPPVATGGNPIAVAADPLTNQIYVANKGSGTVTVIDGATNATTTVTVGNGPDAIVVNAATNQIYVANNDGGTVTVIDGATNATSTVAVGTNPDSITVNSVTDKIYVANEGSGTVTVIDGATNATSTVTVGTDPDAIAVNPVTNQIYVVNSDNVVGGSGTVTVIDGATNAASTVRLGGSPVAIAVNPVTNQIYVANTGGTVTVINGATNATSKVNVGTEPVAIAVNPVTNQIYVGNNGNGISGGTVTVIDGATNAITTVNTPTIAPYAVAVNPVTNQIYVGNDGDTNTVVVIDGATNATSTVSAGTDPTAIAVNPVTNQAYAVNQGDRTVTVIDGATNATTTVSTGTGSTPVAIAVNPATNQIYVADKTSNTVTVVDGATNTASTVNMGAGSSPVAVAVNPVTNQIYVANNGDGTVTVINETKNVTTTVNAGSNPDAVAVNPVTNYIYVANNGDGTVTVIDGETNATRTVTVGSSPDAVAVNPVTNRIYVANYGDGTVTVIDGATNATATVGVGSAPYAVAVNPVTNRIYVANLFTSNVTVIDGATNATVTVNTGINPYAIAVNPLTDEVYVANNGSNTVTVIDGTNATSTVNTENNPQAVTVNTVTNQVYVANYGSNTVTVIDGGGSQPVPLTVTAGGVGDSLTVNGTSIFATVNSTPAFTATVTSNFANFPVYSGLSAADPAPANLYYWDGDSSMSSWKPATVIGGPYQNPAVYPITLPQQSLGVHTLYLFADYGDEGEGISSSAGVGSSPVISNLQAVSYAVLPAPTTTTLMANVNPQSAGNTVSFTATVTPGTGRTAVPIGSVYFFDGSTLLGKSTLAQNGSAYIATYAWTATEGLNTIEAVYDGDGNYASSAATLTETVEGTPAAINIVAGNNQTGAVGTAFTYALEVQAVDADNIPVPNVAVNFSGTGLSLSSGGAAVTNANGMANVAATPTTSGTLNVTASVAGLAVTAIFTEMGTGSGQETPAIAWTTPAAIAYGTALSGTQLNATASYNGTNVPGTFIYTPASGTMPGVGAQSLSVTFTPNDQTTYTTATAKVILPVTQATPKVTWATPAATTYGTALSATQLNATASYNGTTVAGGFSYSPAAGTVLTAGTPTLSVTFTPSDTTDYAIATTTVSIVVNQATPSLNWTAPASISYGTPLTSAQLNATTNVPGQFTYTPELGTVLGAGTQMLSVSFTPDDTTDYKPTSTTVQIVVGKATPAITWAAPAAIQYGMALGTAQLDATANVTGSFSYTPAAGTVLGAGSQTLGVSFTPADTTDYVSPAAATVLIVVSKATPVLSWVTPASIPYGTALGSTQLNATANVAGSFSYMPAAGTVPGAGPQTLSVMFTPTDTTDYGTVTASVMLAVTSTAPTITWTAPTAITYGTPLTSAQLDASANVAGAFSYSPGLGAILPAGKQTLSAIFTPSNTSDYSSTTATTTIVVNQATPVIIWELPANIYAGTPLSATQLNAAASGAGSFTYSPAAGTVLPVGTTTLTATFTPADTTDYASPVTATVQLTVTATDFSLGVSPAQQTILAGNSAAYVITVAPLSGDFSNDVTFSASGLSAGVTASFSPSSVTPGTAATSTTMTLSTSSSTAGNRRPLLPIGGGMGVLAAMLAGFGLRRARKASRRFLVTMLALFALGAATALTGCGGNGPSPYNNYTVIVTATAGSVSHTTQVILTVE